MIFSAAGLSLYFNKSTFAVERMAADKDPEAISFVFGKTFGLPSGNNFLTKSEYASGAFSAEFLYFNEIVCSLVVEEKQGAIFFSYEFENQGKEPISLKEGELGISLPFCDRYDDAEISLRRRVHAHLRTEGSCYAYCERYNGELPALGMLMTDGECYSYDLERGVLSGERGALILRLPARSLLSGESYSCRLCFFLCDGREDFFRRAEDFGLLTATIDDLVLSEGEEVRFRSDRAKKLQTERGEIAFVNGEARLTANGTGEHRVTLCCDDKVLLASYFVLPKSIAAERVSFVREYQYISDGKNKGAFAAFDYNRDAIAPNLGGRSHHDFGGYLAAPLLFLLHEGAQGRLSEDDRKVVDDALAFYDREIYRGGEVRSAGGKRALLSENNDHYPLFAAIKYEEYRYNGDLASLVQSAVILENYFKNASLYALTPAVMIAEELRKANKSVLSHELIETLSTAADRLLSAGEAGLKRIPFSARFVCGAFSLLVDAYRLTDREEYLVAAKKLLPALTAFSFPSHVYSIDEVPALSLRDVGKNLIYDMSPHFSAIHFAVAYDKYYRATEDEKYSVLSRKIARACLTLFEEKGAGCRSKAAAFSVNDTPLSSYEEISCGEDVVLYHFDLLFGRN